MQQELAQMRQELKESRVRFNVHVQINLQSKETLLHCVCARDTR